jgi:hypothetical protein
MKNIVALLALIIPFICFAQETGWDFVRLADEANDNGAKAFLLTKAIGSGDLHGAAEIDAYIDLGEVKLGLEELSESRDYLNQALELSYVDPGRNRGKIHFLLGQVYDRQRNPSGAIVQFDLCEMAWEEDLAEYPTAQYNSQLFKFRAWTRSGIDNASARDIELALSDAYRWLEVLRFHQDTAVAKELERSAIWTEMKLKDPDVPYWEMPVASYAHLGQSIRNEWELASIIPHIVDLEVLSITDNNYEEKIKVIYDHVKYVIDNNLMKNQDDLCGLVQSVALHLRNAGSPELGLSLLFMVKERGVVELSCSRLDLATYLFQEYIDKMNE